MGVVNFAVFLGARCRLYRRKDARIFNGWIQYFKGSVLIVTTEDEFDCPAGERFYVEAAGPGVKACLDVVKEGEAATGDASTSPSSGGDRALSFKIVGRAQLIESDEQSRMLVSGMIAELTFGSATVQAAVHDVSESGLGLIVDQAVAAGIQVELQLETPAGTVHCNGTVIYARPCGDGARIGVALDEMSRIDGSRWRRLLGMVA